MYNFAPGLYMEVIIWASKWVVGGQQFNNTCLPTLSLSLVAYMDNITTLTTTAPCTKKTAQKTGREYQLALHDDKT